jgi:radical SAM protein with 4Fe4S-binding SPASM domain
MERPYINPGFRVTYRQPEEWNDPPYQEYRRMWNAAPTEGIVTTYPLNLDIEITNTCNLDCPFCVREYMKDNLGFMDMETYFSIMDEIKGCVSCKGYIPARVGSVRLNWRGEPTLHPDLPDMVGMAKACLIPEVGINTNGTKLTPVLSRKLIEARIDRIIISIDSFTPELYEAQRVGAKLEPVLANLRSLIKLRDMLSVNGRPYIRVQKVDLPECHMENEDYVNFFLNMGVDAVAINTYKEKNDAMVDWDPLPCAQPFQRMGITWDGYFYPCCQGQLFGRIGHIKDMSVKTAWNSPLMQRLRLAHGSGAQAEIPQCRKCETTKPAED